MRTLVEEYACDDRDKKYEDCHEERDGYACNVPAYDAITMRGVDGLFRVVDVMHFVLHFAGYVVDHGASRLLDVSGVGCRHERASGAVLRRSGFHDLISSMPDSAWDVDS